MCLQILTSSPNLVPMTTWNVRSESEQRVLLDYFLFGQIFSIAASFSIVYHGVQKFKEFGVYTYTKSNSGVTACFLVFFRCLFFVFHSMCIPGSHLSIQNHCVFQILKRHSMCPWTHPMTIFKVLSILYFSMVKLRQIDKIHHASIVKSFPSSSICSQTVPGPHCKLL